MEPSRTPVSIVVTNSSTIQVDMVKADAFPATQGSTRHRTPRSGSSGMDDPETSVIKYRPAARRDRRRRTNRIIVNTELPNLNVLDKLEQLQDVIDCSFGLKLLDVLKQLRQEQDSASTQELTIQLDVFDRWKATDDDNQLTDTEELDLASHLDLFNAILKQIADTPQEISFLSILQHLIQIDTDTSISDTIWDTVEKLIHRATLLEKKEDAEPLLLSGHIRLDKAVEKCCQCACHEHQHHTHDGRMRKEQSTGTGSVPQLPPAMSPTSGTMPSDQQTGGVKAPFTPTSPILDNHRSKLASNPPTPPPPPLGVPEPSSRVIPPPPPPGDVPQPPPPSEEGPPPPPPPPGGRPPPPPPGPGGPPPPPPGPSYSPASAGPSPASRLPQQESIPEPKSRMRKLQWNKISVNKVMGKDNMWMDAGKQFGGHTLDYNQMEQLFAVKDMDAASKQNRDSSGSESGPPPEKKKKSDEVNLLDSKRSLNVNVFLRQFRISHDEIISYIAQSESDKIGGEKLRGLLKILPEKDEIEMLKDFSGDKTKLGKAEKFLLNLTSLANYKFRIEALQTKEEFNHTLDYIKAAIDAVILTCRDLRENNKLKEILYMVLIAGNFLNKGGYAGDAAGFKLSSLLKLTEIRANKPRMNLMHYVCLQAYEKNKELLTFYEEIKYLKEAAQYSVDTLKSDITSMRDKIQLIAEEITEVDPNFEREMRGFLDSAQQEIGVLELDLAEMEELRTDLAQYFCEDEVTFKLEECIKTFNIFCDKFKKAIQENEERRQQEIKVEQRQKQREEQIAMKKKNLANDKNQLQDGNSPRPMSIASDEGEGNIVDKLLGDIRSGFTTKTPDDVTDGESNSNSRSNSLTNALNDGTSTRSTVKSGDDAAQSPQTAGSASNDLARQGSFYTNRKPSTGRLHSIEERKSNSPNKTSDEDKRVRRSGEIQSTDDLIDFLSQTSEEPGLLERQGSQRRSGRRGRKNSFALDSLVNDRERASSPVAAQNGESKWRNSGDNSDIDRSVATHILERHNSTRPDSPKRLSGTDSGPTPSPLATSELNTRKSVLSSSDSPDTESPTNDRRKERERRRHEQRASLIAKMDTNGPDNSVSSRVIVKPSGLITDVTNSTPSKGDLDPKKLETALNAVKETQRKEANSVSDDNKPTILQRQHSAKNLSDKSAGSHPGRAVLVSESEDNLKNYALRHVDSKTDVDEIIKDVEKTGREIQLIEFDEKNKNEINANNKISRPSRLNQNRRTRTNVSKDDVHAALQGIVKPAPVTEDTDDAENEGTPVAPPRKYRGSNRIPISNLLDSKSPLRQRLDDATETITEKAMLQHQSGRWKSDVDTDDVKEAIQKVNGECSETDTSIEHPELKQRPYSTYDNVPTVMNGLESQRREKSVGDVSGSPKKRWGRVFDENASQPPEEGTSLKRSNTLPRRWKINSNKFEAPSTTIEEESKPEITDNTCVLEENKTSATPVLTPQESGYFSLDRGGRVRKSLRINSLAKQQESPIVTTARKELETNELDSKVHEFQAKQTPLGEARKQRFKALSRMYSADDNEDLWASPSSKQAPSTPTIKEADHTLNIENIRPELTSPVLPTAGEMINSPRNSRFSGEFGCKSDTDSIASAKDEGFESESVSDPSDPTVSQRTSMSSTLESELCNPGTPNLSRKDYSDKSDVEEPEEPKNYFARSIDSLVLRPELTLTDVNLDDDISTSSANDKTPTGEDKGLAVWNKGEDKGLAVWNKGSESINDTHISESNRNTKVKASDRVNAWNESFRATTKPKPPTMKVPTSTTRRADVVPQPPRRTSSRQSTTPTTTPLRRSTAMISSPARSVDSNRTKPRSMTGRSRTSTTSSNSSGSSTPTKGYMAPRNAASAVTDRLSRPKRPSAPAKGLPQHASNSSLASDCSTPSKTNTPRSTRTRTSLVGSRNSAGTSPSATVPTSPNSFVRGSGARATLPASILSNNKKAAALAREGKDAPEPPRRTSSIRVSERLNLNKGSPGDKPPLPSNTSSPSTTLSKPKRTSMSSRTFSTREGSKSDGAMSRFISRLSTPKTAVTRDSSAPNSPKPTNKLHPVTKPSDNQRTKTMGNSPTARVASPSTTNDKSVFSIRKIMDRKTPTNKSEVMTRPRRMDMKTTTTSSKC